jgi:hypothetical protein
LNLHDKRSFCEDNPDTWAILRLSYASPGQSPARGPHAAMFLEELKGIEVGDTWLRSGLVLMRTSMDLHCNGCKVAIIYFIAVTSRDRG